VGRVARERDISNAH